MATSTGMTRLESFPFTSHDDGYDADGYPVYDRAVGSGMLRDTFAKFFTSGIFPNPGTALQIGKASSGLAVTIQPGIGIIKGAMGGIRGDQPITVTLDTQAPQGNVAYGIMLRFDNTDGFADSRSLLINVVRGDASSSPTPPAPDTTTPEVYELRLGYVTVPSGATDLSNATVTNEKGLEVCPYAAPFEEIDVSGIVSDFKASADEALAKLLEYYDKNKAAIDAALDDSEATYLQQQISAIQEQLENFDLAGSVDNETVEYAALPGEIEPKLRVKDGGIGDDQIASQRALVPMTGAEGQVLSVTESGGLGWSKSGGKLLWEGAVNSGTISVTESSCYDVFGIVGTARINQAKYYFVTLCSRFDNGVVYGGAATYPDNPAQSPGYLTERGDFASFDARIDGESWIGNNAPSSFIRSQASNFNSYAQLNQIWGIG